MRIGIDLGGTKTEIAALDDRGAIRYRRRTATPTGSYLETIEVIAGLVEGAEAELGTRGTVGIATPGAPSPRTGRMRNANSTWLNERPLKGDLEARLGREVRLENDANCFALSEATDGAGQGKAIVFGVILGTGVGGGIVVNGRVLTGAHAIAGEWGHNPLPLPQADDEPLPACYCGRRGCIETYLSGPGMSADHARVNGESLAAEEIARRAQAGDAASAATIARYEERLARALAGVINILDPGVIVLGGGLSRIASLYRRVPARWAAHVFCDECATPLLPPVHGDSGGVRGAAWLWNESGGGAPRT